MKPTRLFDTDVPPPTERVILAGLLTGGADPELFEIDMKEMRMLCATAGATIAETVVQRREAPVASTYLGPGKLSEICALMKRHKCRTVIIDAQLSPGQVRNIEKIVEGKVIDRGQLILDIFARHARTNEARIQVELAQMKTLYPRLTHAWTHFSQQVGGIGTKGPGEKQLEVDRRLIQKKISDLNDRLKDIEKSRATQRKSRSGEFKVTLVGYTNVGKSCLLNALSGASVLVQNKLFATLDTATRRTFIPGAGEIVLSDTVGFLRKLPHHLVASFRGTLEVVSQADLLLIVMDAASPWSDRQLATVKEVLADLSADRIPHLLLFNKIDLVSDPVERKKLLVNYPDALFVSAFSEQDMKMVKEHIAEIIRTYKKDATAADIIAQKTRELNRDPDEVTGLPWDNK
ncbi:MAG TPA: GTPase HflX [Chitinivibrionales bacterium]|jgi:GTP-binding protein HflX|nr:GTPase HflX [Chitinivibrionales bacterium]